MSANNSDDEGVFQFGVDTPPIKVNVPMFNLPPLTESLAKISKSIAKQDSDNTVCCASSTCVSYSVITDMKQLSEETDNNDVEPNYVNCKQCNSEFDNKGIYEYCYNCNNLRRGNKNCVFCKKPKISSESPYSHCELCINTCFIRNRTKYDDIMKIYRALPRKEKEENIECNRCNLKVIIPILPTEEKPNPTQYKYCFLCTEARRSEMIPCPICETLYDSVNGKYPICFKCNETTVEENKKIREQRAKRNATNTRGKKKTLVRVF